MKNYEIKKQLIIQLRKMITDNPIVIGDITINTILRERDTKEIDSTYKKTLTNYIKIIFEDYFSQTKSGGNKDELRIHFDIYSTNEIMVERLATEFKTRLEGFRLTPDSIPLNSFYNLGVADISTTRVVRRITSSITYFDCN